jgi:hypothetical protein
LQEKYVVLAPPQGEWYAGVQNMDKDGNVAHYTISYLGTFVLCHQLRSFPPDLH